MEISNLSDAELKTLAIRMLKELTEDLSSLRKIQSATKAQLQEEGVLSPYKGVPKYPSRHHLG